MPLLQLMPWCVLDRDYTVGPIKLRRVNRDYCTEVVDKLTWCRICRVLAMFKCNDGTPVKEAVVVQYENHDLLRDLSDKEREDTTEFLQFATFAALANRDYFGHFRDFPPNRCNSSDFQLLVQTFDDEPTTTNIQVRAPEGFLENQHWPISALSISRPIHATNRAIRLDDALVNAMVEYREKAISRDWTCFSNAITCFNFANTCDSTILPQVEWVLLLSAFQQALGTANQKAGDVATRFRDKLKCTRPITGANSSRLRGSNNVGEPLYYHWMKEFYDLRGEYAHGKFMTNKPACWSPLEHLCLARFVFPLLIRCVLEEKAVYALTQYDRAQLAVFEKFADADFFAAENCWTNEHGSLWARLLRMTRVNESSENLRTAKRNHFGKLG